MKMRVSCIIPAHNEEKTIEKLIKKTKKFVDKIIVVDDGSTDKTFSVAEKTGTTVLNHIINLGKGAALKTGCDYAIRNGAKILITMDADLQHDPKEIPNFLKHLKNYNMVLAYRKLNEKMPSVLKFGNWFINKMIKLLYKLDLKDTQCGFRAFTADTYKKIRWNSADYSLESEIIANLGKNNLSYKEIPIQTVYSDKYKGTTLIDGVKIVLNMIWWRFIK